MFLGRASRTKLFSHALGREQCWSELRQGLLLVAAVSQPCHLPCFADATQVLLARAGNDRYILASPAL